MSNRIRAAEGAVYKRVTVAPVFPVGELVLVAEDGTALTTEAGELLTDEG